MMAALFEGFSGTLDEAHQLRHEFGIRTRSAEIVARHFRVKILHPQCDSLRGLVSAKIRGAAGAVERAIFPEYENLWARRKMPDLPKDFLAGRVEEQEIELCGCFPEYKDCDGDEAEALAIVPEVPSVGFLGEVCLTIKGLQPGTMIKVVVALSDDVGGSSKRRHGDGGIDTPPTKDSVDLAGVTVPGDGAARADKG